MGKVTAHQRTTHNCHIEPLLNLYPSVPFLFHILLPGTSLDLSPLLAASKFVTKPQSLFDSQRILFNSSSHVQSCLHLCATWEVRWTRDFWSAYFHEEQIKSSAQRNQRMCFFKEAKRFEEESWFRSLVPLEVRNLWSYCGHFFFSFPSFPFRSLKLEKTTAEKRDVFRW